MNEQIGPAGESSTITVERVQTLLGSLEGRLPLLMELKTAIDGVRRTTDEVIQPMSPLDADSFSEAVAQLDQVTRPVVQGLAWITAWGQRGMHEPVLRSALQRLANIADQHDGQQAWLAVRRWPAVLSLAAIGTAAVDAQQEDSLGYVLSRVIVRHPNRNESAATGLSPTAAIAQGVAGEWLGKKRHTTPVDDLLSERMAAWLAPDLLDSIAQVNDCFDRYQFLVGLTYFDETSRGKRAGWAPVGAFKQRRQYGWTVPDDVAREIERQGGAWPLVSAGLFGFDPKRAEAALEGYGQLIERER